VCYWQKVKKVLWHCRQNVFLKPNCFFFDIGIGIGTLPLLNCCDWRNWTQPYRYFGIRKYRLSLHNIFYRFACWMYSMPSMCQCLIFLYLIFSMYKIVFFFTGLYGWCRAFLSLHFTLNWAQCFKTFCVGTLLWTCGSECSSLASIFQPRNSHSHRKQ
jgi:hypothetical protein